MRNSLFIAAFAAGLLAGVIGTSFAADEGSRTISAAGDGAWILGANGGITYCWARSNPTGSKDIDCTQAAAR